MRKGLVGAALLFAVLLPGGARAVGPVTLVLVDPVSVAPGTPQGWGFTITNSLPAGNFLVVTSVSASPTLTALGTFTDFAAQFQYVVVAGAGGTATQTFDNATQTGAASLLVVTPNATATGTITMTYDVYSVDPTSGGFNPLTDGVSFGNSVQAPASFGTTPVALTGFEVE